LFASTVQSAWPWYVNVDANVNVNVNLQNCLFFSFPDFWSSVDGFVFRNNYIYFLPNGESSTHVFVGSTWRNALITNCTFDRAQTARGYTGSTNYTLPNSFYLKLTSLPYKVLWEADSIYNATYPDGNSAFEFYPTNITWRGITVNWTSIYFLTEDIAGTTSIPFQSQMSQPNKLSPLTFSLRLGQPSLF